MREFLRYPDLWRGDDHVCEGGAELRTGSGPGAAWVCPERGAGDAAGGNDHAGGYHHGGRRGEEGHGDGPEVYRSLRPLPLRGLHFGESGPEDYRIF